MVKKKRGKWKKIRGKGHIGEGKKGGRGRKRGRGTKG